MPVPEVPLLTPRTAAEYPPGLVGTTTPNTPVTPPVAPMPFALEFASPRTPVTIKESDDWIPTTPAPLPFVIPTSASFKFSELLIPKTPEFEVPVVEMENNGASLASDCAKGRINPLSVELIVIVPATLFTVVLPAP